MENDTINALINGVVIADGSLQEIILKDITNSTKWPVSEKLSKALFTSLLPSHLECEICLDVLSNPVQTSCCGQSYCKDCISKIIKKVCPHCRENLEVFPDKKSIRFMNELEVKCPYHIENKCRWKGSSSELNNHLRICNYKPVLCSLGCGAKFEKRNEILHSKRLCNLRKIQCEYCEKQVMEKHMIKHHDECPKMPLTCPNACSSKKIPRDSIKEHIEVCPDQVVTCRYSEFGCNEGIKRKDHDQHLTSTMEQHLHLVAEYAKKERNAREMLEEKIEQKIAAAVAEYATKERNARKMLEEKIEQKIAAEVALVGIESQH